MIFIVLYYSDVNDNDSISLTGSAGDLSGVKQITCTEKSKKEMPEIGLCFSIAITLLFR